MLIIDILRFMSISKGFQGRRFSLNKRSCVGVFDWLVGWLSFIYCGRSWQGSDNITLTPDDLFFAGHETQKMGSDKIYM